MNHEISISTKDIPEQTGKRSPEWNEAIAKHAESGMSATRYCREHEIDYKMFVYHRRKLRRESNGDGCNASRFVRMAVSNTGRTRLILPHGIILETEAIPEVSWIAKLARAL